VINFGYCYLVLLEYCWQVGFVLNLIEDFLIFRTQKRAEVRRQRSIDAGRDYSPLGTSSGSGSRITLNENDSDSSNGNGDSNKGKLMRMIKFQSM